MARAVLAGCSSRGDDGPHLRPDEQPNGLGEFHVARPEPAESTAGGIWLTEEELRAPVCVDAASGVWLRKLINRHAGEKSVQPVRSAPQERGAPVADSSQSNHLDGMDMQAAVRQERANQANCKWLGCKQVREFAEITRGLTSAMRTKLLKFCRQAPFFDGLPAGSSPPLPGCCNICVFFVYMLIMFC